MRSFEVVIVNKPPKCLVLVILFLIISMPSFYFINNRIPSFTNFDMFYPIISTKLVRIVIPPLGLMNRVP